MTALMGAAYSRSEEIVEFLIDQGVTANAINHLGGTAYSIAKFRNATGVLEILSHHYSPSHKPGIRYTCI